MIRPSALDQPAAPPRARLQFDNRYIAPLLITTILFVGQITFGFLEGYPKTLLAIGTSIVTEIVLSLLVYRKFPHLASAYVSGISVGIIIRSPFYWAYALCAAISIMSKYVLQVKGRHIWNPSNFGISILLFLAPLTVSSLTIQWGNSYSAMAVIWAVGTYIIWRLKRFHICATYVVSYVVFAGLRSLLSGHPFLAELAPITGPVYQLFIFFMITDPKSTVSTRKGQMLVAFGVAAAECLFRMAGNVHAPYFALFCVGPAANLLEIAWKARKGKPDTDARTTGGGWGPLR